MKTGVGFPSYSAQAVWTAQAGNWDADYPPTILGDLIRVSQVARAPGTQSVVAQAVLPAAVPVQFFALINHDLPSGATFRIQGYSNATPDGSATALVYDSAVTSVWPSGGPVDGLQSVRPLVLPAAISMRSVRVSIFAPGQPINIGAIEVAGFWEWPGISPGREMGHRELGGVVDLVGGAKHRPAAFGPRVVSGAVDLMAMSVTSTTGLDFQAGVDLEQPFVWAQDYDDALTWARTCMLVRNEEVSPMVGRLYRHDAFPIKLVEHIR